MTPAISTPVPLGPGFLPVLLAPRIAGTTPGDGHVPAKHQRLRRGRIKMKSN